jgi:DHA2 family multidrug resistance protein
MHLKNSQVRRVLKRRAQVHRAMLAAHVTAYDQPVRMLLGESRGSMMQRGSDASTASMQTIYNLVQRQASWFSFAETFRVMGVFFMLCILAAFVMKKPGHKRSIDGMADPS